MQSCIYRLLFLLLVLIRCNINSYAQTEEFEDVLFLNSGTMFRGIIIMYVPEKFYKIKLADGSIFDIETRLVAKVVREKKQNATLKEEVVAQNPAHSLLTV